MTNDLQLTHSNPALSVSTELLFTPSVNGTQPIDIEIENISMLFRELVALLQKLHGITLEGKILQSLQQFQLHLESAHIARRTGQYKEEIGYLKPITMAGVGLFAALKPNIVYNFFSLVDQGLGQLALLAKNNMDTHTFSFTSQAVESTFTTPLQTKIHDAEAAKEKNNAYLQAGNTLLDQITKGLDQLTQLLRETLQTHKGVLDGNNQVSARIIQNT